jgi:hypothetical protein
MDKVIRVFESHEAAEKADIEYYRSLTGEQRLQILYALIAQVRGDGTGTAQGLERVCRIVERGRRAVPEGVRQASIPRPAGRLTKRADALQCSA